LAGGGSGGAGPAGSSGFPGGAEVGREACRGEGRGLFRRGVGGQAPDDLGEVDLGVEIVDLAVGQQGVEQGAGGAGLQAAHEEVVLQSELGRTNGVLHEVGVELQPPVLQAEAELLPLVQGVVEGLAELALREVGGSFCQDRLIEDVGERPGAGAADQFATLRRGVGPADLLLDEVDLLDGLEGRQHHFRCLVPGFDELPATERSEMDPPQAGPGGVRPAGSIKCEPGSPPAGCLRSG